MNIAFSKYQGAGNDFILIDNRSLVLGADQPEMFRQLCDRNFGIGADGIILLENSDVCDFKMLYMNSDGRPATLCGNGGRCVVAYAKKLGIFVHETDFEAADGPHHAEITGQTVSLGFHDVAKIDRIAEGFWTTNTGSPHAVIFTDQLIAMDVYETGRQIRNSPAFKHDGINVNFIQKINDKYHIRTYERGVENETLSCGSGVTAAALVIAQKESREGPQQIPLYARGGDLMVGFHRKEGAFSDIYLRGEATFVFEGCINR